MNLTIHQTLLARALSIVSRAVAWGCLLTIAAFGLVYVLGFMG